ncbi:YesL family protein [Metabacillus fastidiosus]|uniref:YesL family protein n=1 Tax=Metabacillus fastidiosus TaxID=1458 RepID=UPI002E20E6FE|nr:YesL family protein [Metabacillus fastidiosus]
MVIKGSSGLLYRISDLIMRLVYLNLLWTVFTLLGFIVFGFFPATTAMFAILKKWVAGDTEFSVFPVFWKTYKSEFQKVNGLGFVLLLFSIIFYVDFKIISSNELFNQSFISGSLIVLLFIFSVFCLYFFPVYVHFNLPFFQYFRVTFFMSFISPLRTLIMLAVTVGLLYLLMINPGYIPFFGVSAISFAMMWISNKVFLKFEQREQEV